MENKTLSRKKREELKKNKEEEKKINYDKFVNDLDELYVDLFSNDYGNLYEYFIELLDKKFYCVEQSQEGFNIFSKFIDGYSSHKDEYKEIKINQYLDDVSSEDDVEEETEYEFLNKKIERF